MIVTLMRVKQVKLATVMSGLVAAIIILMPFHAFLTVWLASLFGHYTLLRLWKEILLIFLLLGSIYLFYKDPKLRWRLISYKLHWLLLSYLLVQLLTGIIALLLHHVNAKALGYAWIVNLRFPAFFWVAYVVAGYVPAMSRRWPKWIIGPLLVVIGIGLLQYFVLPYDVLKHVGYSQATIYPYETINHNLHRLRAMSTLRGANPLGAYLVLALSLLAALTYKGRRWWQGVLLAGGLAVLLLSFSRSAWIGMLVSFAALSWSLLKTPRARKLAYGGVLVLAVFAGLLTAALWHNTTFQDAVFHTNDHSRVRVSSNQNHVSAFKDGASDLLHEPFGRGPGTAGPASVYNDHPARIAENYFLQLGQEVGWIGLLLFTAINLVIARALWRRRNQALARGLLAGLVGITFINLLSHAWTDDTLAYLWWGLAGLVIATDLQATDDEPQQAD